MAKRNAIAWRTDLSVEECMRRLREATDPGVRTVFSFSGYKGKKPVLLKSNGNEFRLWKRRYYRNSFAPIFFGKLLEEQRGTRIEGRFGMDPFVLPFMVFWLAVVGFGALQELIHAHSARSYGNVWNGELLLAGMFLFGLLLPKFGQWIGRSEERDLRELLETTLAARVDDSGLPLSVRKIENKPLG
jgi:hypothetical protein